jgi:hypothetical protein
MLLRVAETKAGREKRNRREVLCPVQALWLLLRIRSIADADYQGKGRGLGCLDLSSIR